LQALEDSLVAKYADTLTRGDLIALAGLTAAEVAQTSNGGAGPSDNPIEFPMTWVGRPSCDDPTGGPAATMPSPHLTTQGLLDFFATEFGFTQRDTVAIMGAHSLGKASPPNSGFDGLDGWTTNRIRLDNEFYNVLLNDNAVDLSFEQELTTNQGRPFPDQFFWRRTNNTDGQFGPNDNFGQFMLNSDFALVVDLTDYLETDGSGQASCVISSSGTTSGTSTICPASPLLPIVQEYAASNDDWIVDFRTAYTKLLSSGCDATTCTSV